MAIYTKLETGERIRSTKNEDGSTSKEVIGQTKQPEKKDSPVTQEQASGMTTQQLSTALAQPVNSPVPATNLAPAPTVDLPEPEALPLITANTNSIQGAVDSSRATLDSTLKTQNSALDVDIAKLEKEQERILEEGKELTQPFRESLEKKQREKLKVNENFEANQKLTNELDSLLTQSNELINIATGRQVSGKVLQKSLSKTMADVQGRAGVIQAVMDARNGQITQAYTMIDRTVAAVVADRNDELSYYNTILELNNNKLIKLDAEQAAIATTERNLAVKDVESAQATADYLKELMISPETAQFMADAGVSLTDSIDGVKTKMGAQAKREETTAMRNSLTEAGYDISPTPVPGGIEVEAGGVTLYAKVRPGSELALRMEAQQANINQSNASAANSRASASRTQTGELLDRAAAGDAAAISALGLTTGPDNTAPSLDMIAFASDYAATGKLPTGLPKGMSVGAVAELARSLPKPDGAIVSRNTGLPSTVLSADATKGITAMNEIVNDTLPFMMEKWAEAQRTNFGGTGLVGGIASNLVPSQAMTQYEQARDEFLSKLLVARSGAAVTEQEYARYAALVPGAFNNSFGIGSNGDVKLSSLDRLMETNFDNYLNSNQLTVYGYSKVDVPAKDVEVAVPTSYGSYQSSLTEPAKQFVVGEVIEDAYGRQGIMQPDGSVILINP